MAMVVLYRLSEPLGIDLLTDAGLAQKKDKSIDNRETTIGVQ
jgi:hypothetical protein